MTDSKDEANYPTTLAVLTAVSSLSTVAQTRAGVEQRLKSRELSFEMIAYYKPSSQVMDHNAIDNNQASIKRQIKFGTAESLKNAQDIYEQE